MGHNKRYHLSPVRFFSPYRLKDPGSVYDSTDTLLNQNLPSGHFFFEAGKFNFQGRERLQPEGYSPTTSPHVYRSEPTQPAIWRLSSRHGSITKSWVGTLFRSLRQSPLPWPQAVGRRLYVLTFRWSLSFSVAWKSLICVSASSFETLRIFQES